MLSYCSLHLSKHVVPIIPDAVEQEHVSVQLQELPQLVVGGGGGVRVLGMTDVLHVGVLWLLFTRMQLNAFTAHKLI